MTIKQIAELCEAGVQTIRDWLKAGTEKIGSAGTETVSARNKIAKAGHGRAALFTLEETIAIIRAGGNNTLADLLAQNAAMVVRVKMLESRPRLMLGTDAPLAPPPPPPVKGDYLIGSFPDGVERLTLCPFWPCRYTVLARYLGIRHGLAYNWARKLGIDPDLISASQAMTIWRGITGTPEENA
jgi:hypothetical protein